MIMMIPVLDLFYASVKITSHKCGYVNVKFCALDVKSSNCVFLCFSLFPFMVISSLYFTKLPV